MHSFLSGLPVQMAFTKISCLSSVCHFDLIKIGHGIVKPVLGRHSKEDQKLVFKTDYCLMQVKSIAECSKRAFCNIFDLH